MAKQHVAEQETLGEAMNRTELFFEKNGRNMAYIFLGLLVLAALIFGLPRTDRSPSRHQSRRADRRGSVPFRGAESGLSARTRRRRQRRRFPRRDRRVRFDAFGQPRQALCGYLLPEDGRSGERRQISGEILAGPRAPRSAHNAQNLGLQGDIAVEQQNYARR